MDLASAVQFLLAYEASLKLAPGQKPPPPSPSVLNQLSQALGLIHIELTSKEPRLRFSGLPPSVWSDWPLCCGVDLTPKELKAARSLPPPLLRDRGLLSLFLSLHSCAKGRVGLAAFLAPSILRTLSWIQNSKEPDPAPFPSAHLAVRLAHRLINADDTLDFQVHLLSDDLSRMWDSCIAEYVTLLSNSALPKGAKSSVPHDGAGLSLAKEMAALLDAFCAAQRGSRVVGTIRGVPNRRPLLMVLKLLYWADEVMVRDEDAAQGQPVHWRLRKEVYKEAAALPAYDPVLLLQSFFRNIDSRFGRGSLSSDQLSHFLQDSRFLLWSPLAYRGPLTKLRPMDANTAIRLGLEDVSRQEPVHDGWFAEFFTFSLYALQSGLVQPELILRARPKLLEGLVEGLARKRIRGTTAPIRGVSMVSLLARSPAISFHLRKFFSRSDFLQEIRDSLTPLDSRSGLIRLLVPLAAQSEAKRLDWPYYLKYVEDARGALRDMAADMSPWYPATICDFIIRDLKLDIIREPGRAQPFLQYLSELTEEIAAPKRPDARYGVLMVVGLGKACIAFSDVIARALRSIMGGGAVGPASKAEGGRGPGGPAAGVGHYAWRARLIGMARVLSSLRRRVLHELLPVAEAREAALWEGVREEEVVAALTEGS